MRTPTLSEEQKMEMLDLINRGIPYIQIADKYGISKTTVCRAAKRAENSNSRIKIMQPRRKRAPKTVTAVVMQQDTEFFKENVLDVNRLIKYAVTDLIKINERMKEEQVGMVPILTELIEAVKKGNMTGVSNPDVAKLSIVAALERTVRKAENILAAPAVQIESLKAIDRFISTFVSSFKIFTDAKEFYRILNIFFNALNEIKDPETYERVKRHVLESDPNLIGFFSKWEETELPEES